MPFQRHFEAILGKIVYEFSLYSINSISGPTILLYSIYSIIVCAYGHCNFIMLRAMSKKKGSILKERKTIVRAQVLRYVSGHFIVLSCTKIELTSSTLSFRESSVTTSPLSCVAPEARTGNGDSSSLFLTASRSICFLRPNCCN